MNILTMKNTSLIFICILHLFSCRQNQNTNYDTSFETISSNISGIEFDNHIYDSDSFNYYTYPYLYMGGGVSIGDINNDGLQDLFFTGNMVPNKLYLNKGDFQFEDISESAGVQGDSRWYTLRVTWRFHNSLSQIWDSQIQ